jgi:hypothetical protein
MATSIGLLPTPKVVVVRLILLSFQRGFVKES